MDRLNKFQAEINAKSLSNKGSNKQVYSAEHGFTINTDYCKEIFNGHNYTYTFPVYREQDNGLLENLWLIEEADSTYRAFLVQYSFTQEEITAINFRQQIDTENKISFTELDADALAEDIFGKYYYGGNCYEDEY